MFTLSQLVVFSQYCIKCIPSARPGGRSAAEITAGCLFVCAQVCCCCRDRNSLRSFLPVKSERLFFHVVFSSQLINLRHGIMGCQTSDDGACGQVMPGSAEHNRKLLLRCFMILNPVQICVCAIRGCLAHVFPLIKHNTHAWRKQDTQIQFSAGLGFPLMRKFDDQLQLGLPIILRLQARSHAADLRVHDLINTHW